MVPETLSTAQGSAHRADLYREACNGLRQYSTCVLQMRALTLAQGVILLSGSGWLLVQRHAGPSLMASVFGLLFSAHLYSVQRNYWLHFKAILKIALELEKPAGSEAGLEKSPGPWSEYDKQRYLRRKSWTSRFAAIKGPFILLALSFVALIVAAIAHPF